jgi:arginyl-tRNA synthetase
MQLELHARIRTAVETAVGNLWKIDPPPIIIHQTPNIAFGELATPLCLGLAKSLKKAPRAIAEELAPTLEIEGIDRVEIAGPGYINFHVHRASMFTGWMTELRTGHFRGFQPSPGKDIVEHTNINPNKAAHIGHLRNAAIGDTFVRTLQFAGHDVEVQNYIDNTGVQVADVIVGFTHIENRSLEQVQALINDPGTRFDFYCWDLYAKATDYYTQRDPEHKTRAEALRAMEEGDNEIAEMAEAVGMKVVTRHLETMERIHVRYDVLPRESDILHLKFWDHAFQMLKDRKAIFLETNGKNEGCWVMKLQGDSGEEDKVIVRSNGIVTYVGKDIAYQLWKLGLLERDFNYQVFQTYKDGSRVWVSSSEPGETSYPQFGGGRSVYNVIDVRQSYPQTVVKQGVRALGFEKEADNSIHFSYEMVALTPACAEQLGIELSDEDRDKPFVEVSGRKGQGVKADDLLDTLEREALREVEKRNPDFTAEENKAIAHDIAVGALRYFLLRFTRTAVIAFDFGEALNFDGETGPYIQYAVVRANNIFNRVRDAEPDFSMDDVYGVLEGGRLAELLEESDDVWDLVHTASRLDEIAEQVVSSMEPATLAKFAFTLAQRFSFFYHKHRILSEQDRDRRLFYLAVTDVARQSLTRALDLMGIVVPRRM